MAMGLKTTEENLGRWVAPFSNGKIIFFLRYIRLYALILILCTSLSFSLSQPCFIQVSLSINAPLLHALSACLISTFVWSKMIFLIDQCPIEDGCVEWIYRYIKDCVCTPRDGVSFALGMISVLSWGIAEVPQIITNFKQKSTEGVSLIFLMTWVIGDVFNIAGCFLEPATLPTQMYMALLYTITTVVLVLQTIYYDQFAKVKKQSIEEPLLPEKQQRPQEGSKRVTLAPVPSQPISTSSTPTKFYYMSARSLASSQTPTAGSYLSGSRGSGSLRAGYLVSHSSTSNLRSIDANIKSEPSVARAVLTGVLLVGGLGLRSRMYNDSTAGFIVAPGRKLLQEAEGHSALGEVFGWCMAAIYMGGRIPQIWLNIKRGTVEGLNPLMFVFAVLGNATYVGSILVRSTKWKNLKSNMPWLVDAAVCVALDFLIIAQFWYFYYFKANPNVDDEENEKGC